jgi:adenine-specific DNA-methyltransferase
MAKKPGAKPGKQVEAIRHQDDKRRNIPTAEHQSVIEKTEEAPKEVRYPRNTDLDPQLMWRGKDYQDWNDLVVQAPPLYIQEKIQPKALIDDLMRQTKAADAQKADSQFDLFSDFNGIPEGAEKTEFYRHDQNWSNRMILGDSLQVMASLAEREGLRGKVQCIYFDPPYGIKFNSNFQWSTTSRDVKDGNAAHITREPEQVKAFRDTWRDGIHSYLTYLRDRLTVARDLLTESGSIFVQIGDENVHRVRSLMDEVFGQDNHVSTIAVQKTGGQSAEHLANIADYVTWYARDLGSLKYRQPFRPKVAGEGHGSGARYDQVDEHGRPFQWTATASNRPPGSFPVLFQGREWLPSGGYWKTGEIGFDRLIRAGRIGAGGRTLRYKRFLDDFPAYEVSNIWTDVAGSPDKIYVVQTAPAVIDRCFLMASDPGDLVLDPTCGSGTAAYVAEQRGRRWITIDTSRVALALARARLMGARYSFYLLTDSADGQRKESEVSGRALTERVTYGNVRHGFVCERVPHITLKSIANDAEVDVIWDKWEPQIQASLRALNGATAEHWRDWEVPREPLPDGLAGTARLLTDFWKAASERQREIDASIAAKAEFEYLYDRPYEDKKKVRVAGPFTVESLSPHRMLGVGTDDELIDPSVAKEAGTQPGLSFEQMILDNLRAAGVQQAEKAGRITFTSLAPWPGELICGEGRYRESDAERRAAIFIGPEFGTVGRADLVRAAREAGDAGFDVLIACAFNYEAHAAEFSKLGRIPVLKARMNADLHMAGDLKPTNTANLFVIFGEPDIDILHESDGRFRVHVKGVDVFDPSTGEVRSDGPDGIACWFIDTDYNEESFFVRHAYFLGQNDPYSALRTTLKAEINADAWSTLHSAVSREFDKPKSGRIAVKVINHLGDEVMKVFRVE